MQTIFSSLPGLGMTVQLDKHHFSGTVSKTSAQNYGYFHRTQSLMSSLTVQDNIEMSGLDSAYIEALREHLH